jgi:hypothetical protein
VRRVPPPLTITETAIIEPMMIGNSKVPMIKALVATRALSSRLKMIHISFMG